MRVCNTGVTQRYSSLSSHRADNVSQVVVKFAVLADKGQALATSVITAAFKNTGVTIAGAKTTTKITSSDIKQVTDCAGSWGSWGACACVK